MYYKSVSKIAIVQNIVKELLASPVIFYFIYDCWDVFEKIINTIVVKGFCIISALKTIGYFIPLGLKRNPVRLLHFYIDCTFRFSSCDNEESELLCVPI